MQRTKLEVFNVDGTVDVFYSKKYEEGAHWNGGGVTAAGFALYLEDESIIHVAPTVHKRIRVSYVECEA